MWQEQEKVCEQASGVYCDCREQFFLSQAVLLWLESHSSIIAMIWRQHHRAQFLVLGLAWKCSIENDGSSSSSSLAYHPITSSHYPWWLLSFSLSLTFPLFPFSSMPAGHGNEVAATELHGTAAALNITSRHRQLIFPFSPEYSATLYFTLALALYPSINPTLYSLLSQHQTDSFCLLLLHF